jgi:selenide,water dikinase
MRLDAGTPGLPLTLTKPIGSGVLNNRHKATGDRFDQAVEVMTTLNRDASRAAVRAGIRCATDVTGFGLLGHLYKLARGSGVTAHIDASAVPLIEDALDSAKHGYVSGGTRRNLDWVAPHVEWASHVSDELRILLADAQTSGGLLLAGELPGHPVVGELVPRGDAAVVVS